MELMITVAIVAVLAAVAYPSYVSQIQRSHRAEARDALLQVQLAQEKYFLSNNAYGTLANLNIPDLKLSGTNYYTLNSYYKVTLPTQTSTTFTAKADANGGQHNDGHCDYFQITDTGAKTATNADCWNK